MKKNWLGCNRRIVPLLAIFFILSGFLLFFSCSFEYGTKAETPTSETLESMGGKLISLSTGTKGAVISYSLNGSPQKNYSNTLFVCQSTELTAIATKPGLMPSDEIVVNLSLPKVTSFPTISTVSNMGGKQISLSCLDNEAVLFYTLDGTDPTVNSQRYTQSFSVQTNTEIKVFAAKIGYTPSSTQSLSVSVPKLASPTIASTRISPVQKQITLSCEDTQATLYYTTSGIAPTEVSTEYTSSFIVDSDATVVSVIAVRQGYSPSSVVTKIIRVSTLEAPRIVLEDTLGGKLITLDSCENPCNFYYTLDGTTPHSGSTPYTGAFLCGHSAVIKAYGTYEGYSDSSITESTVVLQQLVAPDLDVESVLGGVNLSVLGPQGSSIYYTLDASDPTVNSTLYSGPLLFTSTKTFKAIAIGSGMENSEINAQSIQVSLESSPTITNTPVINGKQVKIEANDPEASIYYTLSNGEALSHASLRYTDPFTVSSTCTVRALAARAGYADSSATSYPITVDSVDTPVYSVVPAIGGVEVSLSCTTPGTSMFYTKDGTQPSIEAIQYETSFVLGQSCMIKTIAMLSGFSNSSISETEFSIPEIATPVFAVDSSTPGLKKISLSCATSDVSLYYTLDDTEPTTLSNVYVSPINLSSTSTLRVLAVKSGFVSALALQEIVIPPNQIGSTGPGGGLIFFDKGSFSEDWRYLEAAPVSTEVQLPWGRDTVSVTGTNINRGYGKANTDLILDANGTDLEYAARYCAGLESGGYTDWFLPSRLELYTLYENLHSQGLGNFSNTLYWCSSQYNTSSAYQVHFGYDGNYGGYSKSDSTNIRAVRRF
jgi:hypothetical protein